MMDLVLNPEDDSSMYILGSVNDGPSIEPWRWF